MASLKLDTDHTASHREALDSMERVPEQKHTVGRIEVARIRVRIRKDCGATADGVEGKVVDRLDDGVRTVAPVDPARIDGRPGDVEALGGLDALGTDHVRSVDRPGDARTTVVGKAGLGEITRDRVTNDDGGG